jgi:hypothetical protein
MDAAVFQLQEVAELLLVELVDALLDVFAENEIKDACSVAS